MAQLSPQLARAHELLADGEWHPRDVIAREMEKVITPGAAVRYAERQRIYSGMSTAPAERKIPRSTEFLVASGKRGLVRDALRAPRMEHRTDENGERFLRLRPANLSRQKVNGVPVEPEQPLTYRRISSHMRRAFEILADGRWHDREGVLEEMAAVVDRDIALAYAERRRQDAASRRAANLPERRRRRDDAYLIASGSRGIVMDALLHAKRIERKTVGGRTLVRLRPTQYGRSPT